MLVDYLNNDNLIFLLSFCQTMLAINQIIKLALSIKSCMILIKMTVKKSVNKYFFK